MCGIGAVFPSQITEQGYNPLSGDVSADPDLPSLRMRMPPSISHTRSFPCQPDLALQQGRGTAARPEASRVPLAAQNSPVSHGLEPDAGSPVRTSTEIHILYLAVRLNCTVVRPIFLMTTALILKFI